MRVLEWLEKRGLSGLLFTKRPEPAEHARRIVAMQLRIVLPIKMGVIAVAFYYLVTSGWWLYGVTTTRGLLLEMLKWYYCIYTFCNVIAFVLFLLWRRFPPGIFQWLVFTLGLLDGLFIAGLTFMTNGFTSTAYWMLPGMIVLNAISIPLATPQLVLNILLSLFYLSAGILDAKVPDKYSLLFGVGRSNPRPALSQQATNTFLPTNGPAATRTTSPPTRARGIVAHWDERVPNEHQEENPSEAFLRLFVLWLLTACAYGVQVLADRQRRAAEEEQEFAVREAQLRTAGRLAAEIAHQLKNPLAIINNTVFSLHRAWNAGKAPGGQMQIIQEEIDRADRIVTDLMGYAQLAEGHVEKLNVIQELEDAIEQVVPAAAGYGIRIERSYGSHLPPLMMQRRHLAGIFVNLLQNAREALAQGGRIFVKAGYRPDYSVEITIADNGPGIPADKLESVFEAYYTTKEKGTGLGLSIVKHNIELYGGSVRAESELGKGARFILVFPAKTVINLTRHNLKTS